MTKNETLNALRLYARKYEEYDTAYKRCEALIRQIHEYQKDYWETKRVPNTIGKTLLWDIILCLFPTGVVCSFLVNNGIVNSKILVIALFICIPVAAFFPLYRYRNHRAEEKNSQIIADNAERHAEWSRRQKELPQMKVRLQEEKQKLKVLQERALYQASFCGLRGEYMDPDVVSCLIDYLESGRSDSLKEALNLFEVERREYLRDQETRAHRARMEGYAADAAEASTAAARNTEEAAFWASTAAMAAFIAAANSSKS